MKVIKQQQKQSIWGNDGNIKVKKRRRRIIQILSKQELDFGSSILQWYSVKRNGANYAHEENSLNK